MPLVKRSRLDDGCDGDGGRGDDGELGTECGGAVRFSRRCRARVRVFKIIDMAESTVDDAKTKRTFSKPRVMTSDNQAALPGAKEAESVFACAPRLSLDCYAKY